MVGNIIVALIVLLAVVISVRKAYKTLSGKSGCGCGCGCGDLKGSNKESSCCCGSTGCSTKSK